MLLNRVSVSSKRRLTLAKKDHCLHQTEPLFEPNRASVYVWFYYPYSLCGYVSTLPCQLRRQERRQNETSIKSQRAASKESASSNLGDGMASKTAAISPAETEKDLPEYIDEGAEDANNSD